MIPKYNLSGVLPPFDPDNYPRKLSGISPYNASLLEFIVQFATTSQRVDLLRGLIQFRTTLKSYGITHGFQWIDGSFLEDVENTQNRPPSDIDLVTFANRPIDKSAPLDWLSFFNRTKEIFSPEHTKLNYFCDAYYIDLDLPAEIIVKRTSYWYSVFSHQRNTYLWKGLIEISLSDDEATSLDYLNNGVNNATQNITRFIEI